METGRHQSSATIELRVGTRLLVSFQRFVAPPDGLVESVPHSRGALPVARTARREWVVPVLDGEAIWIGVMGRRRTPGAFISVSADLADGTTVDAATRWQVPPTAAICGLPRPDGPRWALTRVPATAAPAVRRLRICEMQSSEADPRCVAIELVDAPTFTSLTGRKAPGPLDPIDDYTPTLLP